jgi:hypothetical protein
MCPNCSRCASCFPFGCSQLTSCRRGSLDRIARAACQLNLLNACLSPVPSYQPALPNCREAAQLPTADASEHQKRMKLIGPRTVSASRRNGIAGWIVWSDGRLQTPGSRGLKRRAAKGSVVVVAVVCAYECVS